MLTFADLKAEYALSFDDPWGTTMAWWFAIAGEMYSRSLHIPTEWQYQPGLGGGVDPDAYETHFCTEATDHALIKFGNLLFRYAKCLERHGKAY